MKTNRSYLILLFAFIFTTLGCLEPSYEISSLTISTEKDIFHSNETMKVRVGFDSTNEGYARVQVSGIENVFGRAFISATKEVSVRKGLNTVDFVFTTPSCEECSALTPGIYTINATVNIGSKTFKTYREITLESAANLNVSILSNSAQKDSFPIGEKISVEYFYDPACSICEKASPVIDRVVNSSGDKVVFSKYNVKTDEGLELAKKYKIPGVPSIVINRDKERIIYERDIAKLEITLKEAIQNSSVIAAPHEKAVVLSIPSVLAFGFIAGFNPCLLAILAFIASVTLATTGKRRNVLLIVSMFSLGIFMTYLILGMGLLRIIEESPLLQNTVRNILALLIAFLGLWHVYDAYHLRKSTESSFYTPRAFLRITENFTKKVSLPASFFTGALFSLIKAPCVGAVYFVILDMVRSGEGAGFLYLAAYNLGVVLPVLVLGAAIAFGLNPEKVESFRKEKRAVMRIITGVTLLIIALLMYAGII